MILTVRKTKNKDCKMKVQKGKGWEIKSWENEEWNEWNEWNN